MKYMLLAYSNVAEWDNIDVTSDEFLAMCKFYEDLEQELTESGEFVESRGLPDPSHSKVVRKVDGTALATDGPFGEAKELDESAGTSDLPAEFRHRSASF